MVRPSQSTIVPDAPSHPTCPCPGRHRATSDGTQRTRQILAQCRLQSRSEYGFDGSVSDDLLVSARPMSRLGDRVQHGLTPMKLSDSIWSGSLAPKVMVKWLSISWCLRFCSVSGRWLGCIFLLFLLLPPPPWFSLASCAVLSNSSFDRRPHGNVLASLPLLVADFCEDDDALVAVVVVELLSVWEMVSELSDLRSARRKRSRMVIVRVV